MIFVIEKTFCTFYIEGNILEVTVLRVIVLWVTVLRLTVLRLTVQGVTVRLINMEGNCPEGNCPEGNCPATSIFTAIKVYKICSCALNNYFLIQTESGNRLNVLKSNTMFIFQCDCELFITYNKI